MNPGVYLRKPAVSFVLKIGLSATALYIVFRKVDLGEMGAVLRQSEWLYLLPVVLLIAASKVLSSFRLNGFFRAVGLRLSERQNLRLYWLGMYYNLFLPGGIGGDAYKVYLLRQQDGVRTRDLVWAALLDRGVGMLALLLFTFLLLYWLPLPGVETWMIAPAIVLALVAGGVILRLFGRRFSRLYSQALGWSMGVQGLQLIAVLLLLQMTGQHAGHMGFLFLFLISSLLTALPISYGGAGAREIAFYFGASMLGLPEAPAVSISLLFYVSSLVVSLSGMRYSFRSLELG
jgi:uncharacterized membrane protein YbhN (UPF0104 family)